MADYKVGLNQRKINLNDDYMKFIRFSEDIVERNGGGIVAMITNNSFLDGTTQRVMRGRLMKTFNRIDIFNLHGDIRSQQKNATDQNVFDITQGVAVTIFRRLPNSGSVRVRYTEVVGNRKDKYAYLEAAGLLDATHDIKPVEPFYFFVPKAAVGEADDFSLDEFFPVKSSGIQTKNDEVAISWTVEQRNQIIEQFRESTVEVLRGRFPETAVWSIAKAKDDIVSGEFEPRTIAYRPFDQRYTVLTRRSGGFLGRPRFDVMQHIGEADLSLIVNKKHVGDYFSHVSVARSLVAHGVHYLGNRGQDYACPMYLTGTDVDPTRRLNFDPKLYKQLQELGTDNVNGIPGELAVFDYIYGMLHSPAYREVYAEILQTGFPRIPWPASSAKFWEISSRGQALRELHLMESAAVGEANFPLAGAGDNIVDRPRFEHGHIWINATQYFENVPPVAWSLFVGGYQPAQKWLKDRRERVLTFGEVRHYQRMLKVLAETDRIMETMKEPMW